MIKEAEIELDVEVKESPKRGEGAFYNKDAKLSRDICTLFSDVIRPEYVIDLNAASGAMGLRICKSINYKEAHFYDVNEEAIEICKRNIQINKLENCYVLKKRSEDAQIYPNSFILIDPFGSPAPIYRKVIDRVPIGSFISIKSTDIGTLCGRYPGKARKTYGQRINKNSMQKEIGIRALIQYLESEANKYNKSIRPIISYSTTYYIHSIIKVVEKVEKSPIFANIDSELNTTISKQKNENSISIYSESCNDISYTHKVLRRFINKIDKYTKDYETREIIKLLHNSELNYLFTNNFDLRLLCKKYNLIYPEKETLQKAGFVLNYDETISTDKSIDEVVNILRNNKP